MIAGCWDDPSVDVVSVKLSRNFGMEIAGVRAGACRLSARRAATRAEGVFYPALLRLAGLRYRAGGSARLAAA